MAKYVLDFGPFASGQPTFTVFRDVATGTNYLSSAPVLPPLTDGYTEFTWSSGIDIHFRAELASMFITGELDIQHFVPLGEGTIRVDHNYGGVDNLRVYDDDLVTPIDNAYLYFYLKEDYDAGRTKKSDYLRAWTTTGSDGRWTTPVYLDINTYTVVVTAAGKKAKELVLVVNE